MTLTTCPEGWTFTSVQINASFHSYLVELSVLLVAQRLDGGRVDDPLLLLYLFCLCLFVFVILNAEN